MNDKIDQAAELVKTLAHPTRIRIIRLLTETPQLTVTEISQQLLIEQGLVSHHLIKMKNRGILTLARKHNNSFYALADAVYGELIELVIDNPFVRKDS